MTTIPVTPTEITQEVIEKAKAQAAEHAKEYAEAEQRIKAEFGEEWSLNVDIGFYRDVAPPGLAEALQREEAHLRQFGISAEALGLDTFELLELLEIIGPNEESQRT